MAGELGLFHITCVFGSKPDRRGRSILIINGKCIPIEMSVLCDTQFSALWQQLMASLLVRLKGRNNLHPSAIEYHC